MAITIQGSATQQEFGALVGISRQAVGQLVARGILDPNQSAQEMLHAYCGHLREMAAGRMASGDLDLVAERARLAKEQADKVAMQNAVARRELAPVCLVEEVLSKAGGKVAGIFDAIPGHIRRRFPQLSAEVIEAIAGEIAKGRNIAASISLDDLAIEQLQDDGAIGSEASEATLPAAG